MKTLKIASQKRALRRAPTLMAAAIALGGVLLAACGTGSAANTSTHHTLPSKTRSTSAGQPKTGGTLTVALAESPDGLDPGHVPAAVDARVMRQLYANLVSESPTGTYLPWLASSWTSNVSDSQWIFNLHQGVTFQDGAPFNAAAVCFNLNRIVSPAEESEYAISLLGPYKSCEALSTYRVQINFTHGYAPFLEALSEPFLGMVSPVAAAAAGSGFNLAPVGGGSGPFEFVKWIQNDYIELKAWSGYHTPAAGSSAHRGPAYLSKLIFQIVPEVSTRVAAVQSGQFDAAETILPTQYSSLKADPSLRVYDVPESGAPYELFFNTDHAPWNNTQMRVAIREAIDVQAIIKSVYFGVETQAWGPLAPNTPGYDPSVVNSWKYDPAAAAKTLSSLGWKMTSSGYREKNGVVLTIDKHDFTPDRTFRQEDATFIQGELKSIGVKVNLTYLTITPGVAAVEHGTYDMQGLSLVSGSPNVMYSLFDSAFLPGPGAFGFDYARLDNLKVDSLLAQAQSTTSASTLRGIDAHLQQLVDSNAWTIPIYNTHYTFIARSMVHGITFSLRGYPSFYGAWLS